MMYVMRVDTPLRHRRFEQFAEYGSHLPGPLASVRQRILILGVLMCLAALFPLPVAVTNGDWSTAGVCLGVLVLSGCGIWWLRRRTRQADAWKVHFAYGANHLFQAHRLYRTLSPRAREHGMPLLEALYRLAATRPASAEDGQQQESRMAERVKALSALVHAEERIHETDKDTRDLQRHIWEEALAEVERAVSADSAGGPP
jgi:hypothetical protein